MVVCEHFLDSLSPKIPSPVTLVSDPRVLTFKPTPRTNLITIFFPVCCRLVTETRATANKSRNRDTEITPPKVKTSLTQF